MKRLSKGSIVFYVIAIAATAGTAIWYALSKWAIRNFNVTMQEIVFTLKAPLEGTGNDQYKDAVMYCLKYLIVFLIVFFICLLIDRLINRKAFKNFIAGKRWKPVKITSTFLRVIYILACAAIALTGYVKADRAFGVTEYLLNYFQKTTVYEDHYVDPKQVEITASSEKRNLIFIYLESMEVQYASKDVGAIQDVNYIPELTKLAMDNISFSDNDNFGGFHSPAGTGWTMGAIFASTSGVPFSFPVEGNSMDQRERFAPGIYTLGDFLAKEGYSQEFLCGSDATFGGRRKYYESHGDPYIFDIYTAREKGYIPPDYYVWWGFEDLKLFEMAKDELTRLSENEEPFAFTMLTVDPHHPYGYLCENCDNKYDEQIMNVLDCQDRQTIEFVNWIKEQPFYENTTVVLIGDHPRMDDALTAHLDNYDRTVYNVFLNTAHDDDSFNMKNRDFTTMDIFPTILSAIGYDIEGNRLGLGTDMFSGDKTLCEEMGYDVLNEELQKYSAYYIDHFA